MAVNHYKTEVTAKRWMKYYRKKYPKIRAWQVRPHPFEFGFAIFGKPINAKMFVAMST